MWSPYPLESIIRPWRITKCWRHFSTLCKNILNHSRKDLLPMKKRNERFSHKLAKALTMELREHKSSFCVYFTLRLLVIITAILQLANRNYENVFLCILTLFLLVIPSIVQLTFKVELPTVLEIIILVFIFLIKKSRKPIAFCSVLNLRVSSKRVAPSVHYAISCWKFAFQRLGHITVLLPESITNIRLILAYSFGAYNKSLPQ